MLPLTTADLLAHAIVGSVLENLGVIAFMWADLFPASKLRARLQIPLITRENLQVQPRVAS